MLICSTLFVIFASTSGLRGKGKVALILVFNIFRKFSCVRLRVFAQTCVNYKERKRVVKMRFWVYNDQAMQSKYGLDDWEPITRRLFIWCKNSRRHMTYSTNQLCDRKTTSLKFDDVESSTAQWIIQFAGFSMRSMLMTQRPNSDLRFFPLLLLCRNSWRKRKTCSQWMISSFWGQIAFNQHQLLGLSEYVWTQLFL